MIDLADLRAPAMRYLQMRRINGKRARAARMARLGLLGLAGGMLAGFAAAGDIASYGTGRVAPAAAPAAPLPSVQPAEGREVAARLGLTTRDDCRTLEPALRLGCLDHVAGRVAAAVDPLDLPL